MSTSNEYGLFGAPQGAGNDDAPASEFGGPGTGGSDSEWTLLRSVNARHGVTVQPLPEKDKSQAWRTPTVSSGEPAKTIVSSRVSEESTRMATGLAMMAKRGLRAQHAVARAPAEPTPAEQRDAPLPTRTVEPRHLAARRPLPATASEFPLATPESVTQMVASAPREEPVVTGFVPAKSEPVQDMARVESDDRARALVPAQEPHVDREGRPSISPEHVVSPPVETQESTVEARRPVGADEPFGSGGVGGGASVRTEVKPKANPSDAMNQGGLQQLFSRDRSLEQRPLGEVLEPDAVSIPPAQESRVPEASDQLQDVFMRLRRSTRPQEPLPASEAPRRHGFLSRLGKR